MIVWVKPIAGELLETLTAAQATGVFPEAPEGDMVLAEVTISEWQRAQIANMMARGKQAIKDGAALAKLYRVAEKARATEASSNG